MSRSSSTTRMLDMLRLRRYVRHRQRQLYDEPGAERLILFHVDGSPVVFNNAAHNRQSQTGAALLGGEIRKEQSFLDLLGHAVSGIGNNDLDGVFALHQRSGNMYLAQQRVVH